MTPRRDVHFPDRADNTLGAWAYRCACTSTQPTSDLLKGRTVCLKDNIAMAGVPCLLGTASFTGWVPQTDATVVTRVLAAGGTVAGKAVCENLSRGAVSATAATGPVDNPYAAGYSAGGSSSGTAALVASGAVDLGLGCDQGGSVRIPAALCGLYGFKATTGLVPYTGIASNDAAVDYVGPITRTCLDCATLLTAVAGVDGLDDRQIAGVPFPEDVPDYAALLRAMDVAKGSLPLKGVRIGILAEAVALPTADAGVVAKFRAATQLLATLGADVREVSVPLHVQGRAIVTVMAKMGNHMGMLGRATGRRGVMLTDLFAKKDIPYSAEAIEKVGPFPSLSLLSLSALTPQMNVTSKDGLLAGELGWTRHALAYPKSVNLMRRVQHAYDAVLRDVDYLVMPTTVTPSNPYPRQAASPLQQADNARGKLENTSPFNGTGHPALAMPIGFVPAMDNPQLMLPASMQIVGRYWDEAGILKVAYAWESAQDWRTL